MLGEQTLWTGDSQFSHYEVVDQRYAGRPARVLFSGQREAVQSGIPLDDRPEMLFDYNQRFFEIVRARQPSRVLLIGGGALTLPTALLHEFPDLVLDVIERDALLVELAKTYFGFKPHPTLNIYHLDGRAYLEHNVVPYDMVLIDAFSNLHIPESLGTAETAEAVKRNLHDDGCVAINILSPYYGRHAAIIRRQLAAYRQVFTQVTAYAADPSESGWQNQNLVLVAENSDEPGPFRYGPLPHLDVSDDPVPHDVLPYNESDL